jgi:L-amino acid N-acyltransferase YncA
MKVDQAGLDGGNAGIWTIQSGVFPENTASLALHHAVGFRTVGVRERVGRQPHYQLATGVHS